MRCFIALGSNLGDREAWLRMALERLRATPGLSVVAVSRLFETEPVGPLQVGRSPARSEPQPSGVQRQGSYLNAAAALETALSAQALLARLLAIEREAGRTRGPEQNAPRTLDLDLLLHGADCIDEPGLVVPHPRLARRAFVLEPLAEIAGEVRHPTLGVTISELAARVRDLGAVRPWTPRGPWS